MPERTRARFIPWYRMIDLDRFGGYVLDAFGHRPYLVGSSIYRWAYRDVDVRLILPDDEFAARFGEVTHPRYENACWNAHCVAWTHFGIAVTRLPIDFQIDQQTQANELYGRGKGTERQALGMGVKGPA